MSQDDKVQVKVYLNRVLHKKFKAQAAMDDKTMSEILEELVKAYLDEKERVKE
ncbi:hypothetical protein GCM10011571_32900 [Marinithermofilum abyssi]|uniref:CopG family transcriptional regulator n=1 Tax=Marinithermofilum abyssi TaxID=1571185 RepID=A0A8J2VJ75_9BACL|nr:hypothetical protein [Marinithermofilum abyssi]GGE28217.1 hypothetical protein GCM10011571_32900 [Marinithermofilum abyssi]